MVYDMIDINNEAVEIKISHDGTIVWINTDECCKFRAQSIPQLRVEDNRTSSKKVKNQIIILVSISALFCFLGGVVITAFLGMCFFLEKPWWLILVILTLFVTGVIELKLMSKWKYDKEVMQNV